LFPSIGNGIRVTRAVTPKTISSVHHAWRCAVSDAAMSSVGASRRDAIHLPAKRATVLRCVARVGHAKVLVGRSDSRQTRPSGGRMCGDKSAESERQERKRTRTSAFRIVGAVVEHFPPAMCMDGRTVRSQQFTPVNGSARGPDPDCFSSEFGCSRPWRNEAAGDPRHPLVRHTTREDAGSMNPTRPRRRAAYRS
jgi:hypothetical protein